jgi:hypothetical protein
MEGDDHNLELLAASLRADAGDLDAFVEGLATKLEEAVPDRVTVKRKRQGMMGPKLVAEIAVDAGGERLIMLRSGAVVQTRRARLSGGIVLKTEELSTDEWIDALGAALAVEASRSDTTRRALERLLTG